MLALAKWGRSLDAILTTNQTAEDELRAVQTYKPIIRFREDPGYTVGVLSGIHVTAHQRLMLWAAHRTAEKYYNVSSRGTAKTATWDNLYATFKGVFYPTRKGILVVASGFRGAQQIFLDTEKWLTGGWADQEPDLEYLAAAIKRTSGDNLVHRAQNFWRMQYESGSDLLGLPTNDEGKLRGNRAHDVYVDEFKEFDYSVITDIIEPWTNVLADFKHGGAKAQKNCMYFTTTVDFNWREGMAAIDAAKASLKRDYEGHQAARRGDWAHYETLEGEGFHSQVYVNFDYTDVIIRQSLTTRDGRTFDVTYPDPDKEWEHWKTGIPFTTRGPDGLMLRDSGPVTGLRTYPINKTFLESGLLTGANDEAPWLSEQRNVIDTQTGDVYPYWLLEKVSCGGEKGCVLPYDKCPADWQQFYKEDQLDYCPTPMFRCSDPCVIGVDYAGGDRDFTAFVVIRLGPLARQTFSPLTQLGKTPWSNVIWAEQHRLQSHAKVAEKIRELMERYNVAWHFERWQEDDWKLCRGIGLDMKGGGTGVRDALVYIDAVDTPPGEKRIYDPLDKDPRIQAYLGREDCLPALDTIMPSDQINDRCVEFTLAQMKVGALYLPKWYDESRRPVRDASLTPGYNGAKILKYQLQKIQQEPTAQYRRFFMPGDDEAVSNKKDAFSAFIYAGKQMRAHIIRQQMIDNAPPPMGAVVTNVNKHRGRRGRSPGSRD